MKVHCRGEPTCRSVQPSCRIKGTKHAQVASPSSSIGVGSRSQGTLMKKSLYLLAFLLTFSMLALAGNNDTVIEEIVARVNNSIITRQDIERAKEQSLQEFREKGAANPEQEAAAHDKDVLRDLINQQLLVQKAQDLGLSADTELIKQLDQIRKQMNPETMD